MVVAARDEQTPATGSATPRPAEGTRTTLKLAIAAALVCVLAALVAALGPAHSARSHYTWPPTVAGTKPERGWFGPLPLLNRVPGSIAVTVPCGLSPALDAAVPATVVATARHPIGDLGFWILDEGRSLQIGVGGDRAATIPWPSGCPLRIEVVRGQIRLPGRTIALSTNTLGHMPVVTGLFTSLDLRDGARPNVSIETRTYATTQTLRQIGAGLLAVVLALVALGLVIRPELHRSATRNVSRSLRGARDALHVTDAVVLGALLVWWVLAPPLYDDGWESMSHRVFGQIGTMNVYIDIWGVNWPSGYWLEWLRHWVSGSTSVLIIARIPTLLCLVATWVLCRVCFARAVRASASVGPRWTLAAMFLVGTTAWGMTLRPEPFISLLTVCVLTAMLAYRDSHGSLALAVGLFACVLALTSHPTGLVAAAPLFLCAPYLLQSAKRSRKHLASMTGVVLPACVAIGLVIFTLHSDMAHRLDDAHIFRASDLHSEPLWREYIRYTMFDDNGAGVAARHLSLGLLLLAAGSAFTRWRVNENDVSTLPGRSVVIGFALLAFVPSKWPWHFGVLVGLGAVALAAEVEQLVRGGTGLVRRLRRLGLLAALAVIAEWSWRARGNWAQLDLGTLHWNDGFGVKGYGLPVLAVLATAALCVRLWRNPRPDLRASRLSSATAWAVPILAFAVLSVTVTLFALDAAVSPWSPARQNVEALAAHAHCGLADQLRADNGAASARLHSVTMLPTPDLAFYVPCAAIPRIGDGLVEIPDYLVSQWGPPWTVTDPDAPFAAVSDLYRLRPAANGPRGVVVLSVRQSISGFRRVDPIRS